MGGRCPFQAARLRHLFQSTAAHWGCETTRRRGSAPFLPLDVVKRSHHHEGEKEERSCRDEMEPDLGAQGPGQDEAWDGAPRPAAGWLPWRRWDTVAGGGEAAGAEPGVGGDPQGLLGGEASGPVGAAWGGSRPARKRKWGTSRATPPTWSGHWKRSEGRFPPWNGGKKEKSRRTPSDNGSPKQEPGPWTSFRSRGASAPREGPSQLQEVTGNTRWPIQRSGVLPRP
ncbi:MAG: hypothetical protein JG766_1086 [Desulfacinum sp.]|nr:hypothetical protein [Desulfacinum sp.]